MSEVEFDRIVDAVRKEIALAPAVHSFSGLRAFDGRAKAAGDKPASRRRLVSGGFRSPVKSPQATERMHRRCKRDFLSHGIDQSTSTSLIACSTAPGRHSAAKLIRGTALRPRSPCKFVV